jgi:DNA-binding GntR family transcriptional regulator
MVSCTNSQAQRSKTTINPELIEASDVASSERNESWSNSRRNVHSSQAQVRLESEDQSNLPIFIRISESLRFDIVQGKYRAESLLPTEKILCEKFGASRGTIREALRILENEGILERRQGSGSLVKSGVFTRHPFSNLNEIQRFARDFPCIYSEPILKTPTRLLCEYLELDPMQNWSFVSGVRRLNDCRKPLAVSQLYLHQDIQFFGSKLDFDESQILGQIKNLRNTSPFKIIQHITAVRVNADIAVQLGMKIGSPCLHVIRSYIDSTSRLFAIFVNFHPGDRFIFQSPL